MVVWLLYTRARVVVARTRLRVNRILVVVASFYSIQDAVVEMEDGESQRMRQIPVGELEGLQQQ